MLKRLPSRNSRSKGIKLKHILQICLLLGICFWLVYQVKHSHDKKKQFDENDVKNSLIKMSEDEILKLGRKDLHPHEDIAKSEKHVEEEEEEKHGKEEREDEGNTHEEEEEEREDEVDKHEEEEREDEVDKHEEEDREDEGNKHEAEEQGEEEENKDEDVEDGGRGGGDDEIDENDQEKKEQEVERDEEFIDEEKKLEEKEDKANENEDKETQVENENSSEHQDNDDGSQGSHEAREEHYKGDDASSAVTHDVRDTQVISTAAEKVNSENSEFNGLQKEYKTNTSEGDTRNEKTSVSMVGEGEIAHNGTYLNLRAEEQVDSSSSITGNSQDLVLSNNQTEARNNSAMGSTRDDNPETSTKASDSSLPIGIGSASHSNNVQNATVDSATAVEGMKVETSFLELTNNSNLASYGNQSDFNSPFPTDFEHKSATLGKSLDATGANAAGKSLSLNGTAEAENNHTSATTKMDADASQNEKSNSELESNRIHEISDYANQHDPVDSSDMHVTEDEKKIHMDPDTLLEIKTGGGENEEAAAE